ncbi:alpha/beta superfamily hydrolase [Streptococcus pseudoporcinus]|uniref:Alpha/beta superfamily hydrolase n=1 Tax=Streptococcus pseudoporcinus TaxID=361101 RepID=A0A4U9ZES5_9STRE|nr:alpha/beta hydrolase [Streptococcus pseudoporcinus]VTS38286.1 alpha/beta superfamily hydrolase [Streptococcus pseudoporcinus]
MYYRTQMGHELYYEIHGQGYPLIFFHGNGQSLAYFEPQLHLASCYQLIMIDTLGHGKSGALTQKTSFAQIAKEIHELLNFLKLESYILVGHSDGANLAIAYENLFPERVEGLLLNAGNVRFIGLHSHYIFSISFKVMKLALESIFDPKKKNAYFVARLMMANQTIQPSLKSNTIPVIVLVGQNDMIRSRHSMTIAENYSNSRVITIPKLGHNINKRPAVLDTVLTELVREAVSESGFLDK